LIDGTLKLAKALLEVLALVPTRSNAALEDAKLTLQEIIGYRLELALPRT
jgi:hypothetical protein